MTKEEAEKYADNMTYRNAINNLMKARSIPYRKATFIKVNELLKALEQETSDDLIQRQAVLDIIHRFFTEEVDKIPTKKTEDGEVLIMCKAQPLFAMNKAICKRIKALPSAEKTEDEILKMQELEQAEIQKAYELGKAEKTGHWMKKEDDTCWWYVCSECEQEPLKNRWNDDDVLSSFCPNCGCRMVEP